MPRWPTESPAHLFIRAKQGQRTSRSRSHSRTIFHLVRQSRTYAAVNTPHTTAQAKRAIPANEILMVVVTEAKRGKKMYGHEHQKKGPAAPLDLHFGD